MSYGISIENESGYLQISDSYTNYVLVASGSVSATAGATGSFSGVSPGDATITGLQAEDIVAVQGSFLSEKYRTSSAVGIYNWQTSTQSISYRVYRKSSNISASTSDYGLEVFDASGNLRFSSKYPPAVVLATASTRTGSGVSGATGAYACLTGTGLVDVFPGEEDGGFIAGEITDLTVSASSSGYSAQTDFEDNYDETVEWQLPVGTTKKLLFIKE